MGRLGIKVIDSCLTRVVSAVQHELRGTGHVLYCPSPLISFGSWFVLSWASIYTHPLALAPLATQDFTATVVHDNPTSLDRGSKKVGYSYSSTADSCCMCTRLFASL